MPRYPGCRRTRLVGLLGLMLAIVPNTRGQGPAWTRNNLLVLDEPQLLGLYSASPTVVMPAGKVRGTPVIAAGKPGAATLSKGARALWQGKVFHPSEARAVNRFAGIPSVPGELYCAPSWLDGRPALILDYARTSHVYARYRDEIRQVGPGTYLGLMYDRTTTPPSLTRLFILEDRP